MSQDTSSTQDRPPDDDMDTLIGRIVDREASPRDYERFEEIASVESSLWRTLALRQIDMGILADRVAEQTSVADDVEVAGRPQGLRGLRALPVLVSGWAAVIALGIWWAVSAGSGGAAAPGAGLRETAAPPPPRALTPDEHLDRYKEAPFVIGELDYILLDSERLEEGRHRLRIMRRIEEFVDIDTPPQAIIDEAGHLTIDPATLRGDDHPRRPDG